MTLIQPVPDSPAAIVDLDAERLVVIADFHAGFEAAVRSDQGIEIPSRAPERRDRLLSLIEEYQPDKLVVLGDLTHSIGRPGGAERAELEVLVEAIPVPILVAKGNHDGIIEEFVATDPSLFGNVTILPSTGATLGNIGIVHGHTWPHPSLFDSEYLCVGHEHPCVRLADEVGGRQIERVWLRGECNPAPVSSYWGETIHSDAELIVFPAFNELCGGTWINVPDQSFLSPFLPDALDRSTVHLLDGTHLGSLNGLQIAEQS